MSIEGSGDSQGQGEGQGGGQGGGEFVRNGPRGWTKYRLEKSRRENAPVRLGHKSISRRRLARSVGVTPGHIGMIWSGKRQPSLELASKIALVFDVTIDELVNQLREVKAGDEANESEDGQSGG